MSIPQIAILGAGISGLVLARCLRGRGITAIIYERDSAQAASKRYNYGITLHSWAYRPLLSVLNLDEASFKHKTAVDALTGGNGRNGPDDSSFRANRNKFETLLRESLDVRWEHKLEDLESTAQGINVKFENSRRTTANLVVGSDGAHSKVRKAIAPSAEFKILPFAVFNGKRRLSPSDTFAANLDSNVLTHKIPSGARLEISLSERTEDQISVSYTYSRPTKERPDPLFKPDRPQAGASDIAPEFFDEVATLHSSLESPFKEIFEPEAMKKDRLLNWLMRSILVSRSDLDHAAEQGIVLMADAAHHGPILGADGANAAVADAIDLANFIAENGISNLRRFYDSGYDAWTDFVHDSEVNIAEMHGVARPNL